MPLYDTKKGFHLWEPKTIESWDIIQAAQKKIPNEFNRMIVTTDEAIESIRPSERSNLTWTKSGALFGYNSPQVDKINHVWENTIALWGEDTKILLLFVGSLLMWRISCRDEQWLTYASKTGKTDPLTGKEITERSYWINEDIKVAYTVQDLITKYKKRF